MEGLNSRNRLSASGLLIALGIIYGDIGTSPLYVFKAIAGDKPISEDLVLGAISCVFWTLTLQTTIKYVWLTLRADNKGEGGIFALYTLVRRKKSPWLVFPAIIGGGTLLADGVFMPPISVASAVEGMAVLRPDIPILPIVVVILALLFSIQRFGTNLVGKFFGPLMTIWFIMLAILGAAAIGSNTHVLAALSPAYAYRLLIEYPGGFGLLGAIFLCTTGAEALYSDLGHVGRQNIRVSWTFVKIALMLNYMGQGAELLNFEGVLLADQNPFYMIMPSWFLPVGIIVATSAAIIASQALITGSFTLISEAMRLNFWPKVRVVYPSELIAQIYIPSVNWMLFLGCVSVSLYFTESSAMGAAYGLAIILTMMMTTVLLTAYLYRYGYPKILVWAVPLIYSFIEIAFLAANLEKFESGGWLTIIVASALIFIMIIFYYSRKIRNRLVEFVSIEPYLSKLLQLSDDQSLPKYSTHLAYLTSANHLDEIEEKVMYSILEKHPKRADSYWFLHVDVVDEPYTQEYKVTQIVSEKVIRVDFRVGFRVDPRVNLMFRYVVGEMVKGNEINITSRYPSLAARGMTGDFRFVILEKYLSRDNQLPFLQKIIMDFYFLFKRLSLPEEKAFGLDTSSVVVERVPLLFKNPPDFNLKRVF